MQVTSFGRILALSAAAAAVAVATPAVAQTTLAESNPTTQDYGSDFIGQSFTVGSAGSSYNSIRFSWLSIGNAGTEAPGTLYLFGSAYTGTPGGLATAPGQLGAVAGSGGVYTFNPSLRLTGGTTYYAYTNVSFNPGGNLNTYSGGVSYGTIDSGGSFAAVPGFDNAFRVTGAIAAVPEPTSWAMMIVGFAAAGSALRRRRWASFGTGTRRLAAA